jgi:hypothetical protein
VLADPERFRATDKRDKRTALAVELLQLESRLQSRNGRTATLGRADSYGLGTRPAPSDVLTVPDRRPSSWL